MNNFPWYLAVFVSIPESILIMVLTLKLLDMKMNYTKVLTISILYALISYFSRNILTGISIYFLNSVHTLLIILLSVFLFHVIFRIEIKKFLLPMLYVFVIYGLIQYITGLSFFHIFYLTADILNSNPDLNIILFIPAAIITYLVVMLFKKYFYRFYCNKKDEEADTFKGKKDHVVLFTILFQLMMMLILNQMLAISESSLYYKNLPFVIIVFAVMVPLIYRSLKSIEYYTQKEVEAQMLSTHLSEVEELIKTLRAERHQYMGQIQVVQAMLYTGKYDSATQYIDQIAGDYRSTGEILRLGNAALTAAVNIKMETCKRKGIDFQVDTNMITIKDDICLSSTELGTVVGNVLDNAIEAVMQREVDRFIRFEVREENGYYKITITNNGPALSDTLKEKIFDAGFSTKQNEIRGYGLYAVKKIMEKYKGRVEVVSDKDETSFILYLPKRGNINAVKMFKDAFQNNNREAGAGKVQ